MLAEFLGIFPGSFYYKRGTYPLKKIVQWASKHGFTHLMVLAERDHRPSRCIWNTPCSHSLSNQPPEVVPPSSRVA